MPGIYKDVDLSQMGTDPGNSGVTRPTEETKEAPADDMTGVVSLPPDFTGKGMILEEQDEKKVFKAIDSIVERQETIAKNREAARKHWGRVRRGVPFSVLNKTEDQAVWTAELPPGASDTPSPIPNKADDLCRKIVSQVIVDIPQPDPKAANDSEQDRGAADLAKRFLKQDGDESGTNDAELFQDVLDSAMTDASEFAHVWVDVQGGGWRPLRILAHPQAEDPANPLVAVDPTTGQEMPTADYVLRYVTESGQFTESAAEASKQWLPKIKRDVLGPQHVRTVPETADVGGASSIILLMVGPLSDLKRRVPEMATWDEGKLDLLASWKPRRARALVPQSLRGRYKEQQKNANNEDSGVDDDTLVFWYQMYCKVGQEYIEGADVYVSGANGGMVLKKATLRNDIEQKEDVSVLLRDIPVSQCKALHDSEYRDAFGRRPLELFGATNEGLAQLYGAVQVDVDKRLHPNTFLPSTSPVQGWQMTQRNETPITVYSKDDLPMYEEFGDLPQFLPDVIGLLEKSMEDASGLGSASKNLNTTEAVSGTAKSIELNQAKVALAPVAMNFLAFVKRYWRVKLQAAQAFLTLPQRVDVAGIDQSYKQRWWTGADFAGVKDVAIQAGTGTLMSPVEKQQYLSFAQTNQWLDPEEAMEVARGTMADDLGLKSSPHEDALKRELALWMEGPPDENWIPQAQAYGQEQQQIQAMEAEAGARGVDTQSIAQAQPQTPAPWSPFIPRPTDDDPVVAKKQYSLLRDFISTSDYSKHEPEWRALIDQRYTQARQAAGIQTVAEQAQAAQMQAEMKMQESEQDRQFKREEGDKNRASKTQPQGAIAA